MNAHRMLALVDITDRRGYDPEYEAVRRGLSRRIVGRAEECGWSVTVHYADLCSADELLDAVAGADAALLAGGEDVDPTLYGQPRGYPREGHHYPRADANQITLVRSAVDGGVPVMGICRGLQVINVALGGTLVRDLGSATIHRQIGPIGGAFCRHPVALTAGGPLAEAMGTTTIDCESAHHQAVDRLGDGLAVVAEAPDGVVEAIVHETAPIVAVQWHPEAAAADPVQFPALLGALDRVLAR